MRDDLETLLRDAGREPTIDIDVDAIHASGRRRAAVRRATTGIGALALVGAVTFGVGSLMTAPSIPPVDPGPVPADEQTEPPTDDEDAASMSADSVLAPLATELQAAVAVVRRVDDPSRHPLAIRIVSPDGGTGDIGAGGFGELWGRVVLQQDSVWFVNAAGDLVVDEYGLRSASAPSAERVVAEAPAGGRWEIIGQSYEGPPLVIADVEGSAAGINGVQMVGDSGVLVPMEFVDPRGGISDDEGLYAGAAFPEELAVLHGAGETTNVSLLPFGGTPRVVLEAGGTERWVSAIGAVGREVWALESGLDGVTDLLLVNVDDGTVRRIGTPAGRTAPGVSAIQTLSRPEGDLVVLTDGDASLLVDVEAARAAAVPSEARQVASDVPEGAFRKIDVAGELVLLPWTDTGPAPTAACATDQRDLVNAAPAADIALWFVCDEAFGSLPEDEYWAYWRLDTRFRDVAFDGSAADLELLLRAWADGPTVEEAALGLTGGLDPSIASILGVTAEGRTAVIDLRPGPQAGVLSTSTGGMVSTTPMIGAALQSGWFDAVRFTSDGSCEAWAALVEGQGCLTYGPTNTPWAQSGG